jgi:hypothetical protein
VECDWLQAPAVIGWLRPVLLLPVTALTGLSQDQLRAVIAHELAHIRRLDYLAKIAQALVEAVFFYHPAAWWLGRRIRAERERCCDEIALSLYGNRLAYARALGLMAESRSPPAQAMAINHGPVADRILCVLGREAAVRRPQTAAGILLLIVIPLCATGIMYASLRELPLPRAALFQHALPRPAAISHDRVEIASVRRKREGVSTEKQKNAAAEASGALSEPVGSYRAAPEIASVTADELADLVKVRSVADPALLPEKDLAEGTSHLPQGSLASDRAVVAATEETASGTTAVMMDETPTGAGAPDEVVCAKPQHQSSSRLLIPARCLPNRQWAKLAREAPQAMVATLLGQQFQTVPAFPLGVGGAAR